jgi:cobalt-zinc-cadmium efflux system outer membrane protein
MNIRSPRWLLASLGLAVAGCLYPVQEKVDHTVCELAMRPRDLAPVSSESPPRPAEPKAEPGAPPALSRPPADAETAETIRRAAQVDDKPPPGGDLSSRLKFPPDLPGANVPPIELPPLTPENAAKRRAVIDKLYPPQTPLGPDPQPRPGPEGHALTLADLQRLALTNSPLIRQAAANVEAARGAAIEAGLPPNPTFGFENDSSGTNGTAGLIGISLEQVLRPANKLQLSRAAAAADLANAELALRRAETDLASQVRGGYFAVLVARENMRVSAALAKFTNDIYDIQVEQVRRGGIAAAYEPAQLRVLAVQARANVIQARHRYTSAWKQLAAALGLPGMPPTELAGRIDIPIPRYDHEKVLARALQQHTDVLTARNTLQKNQYNLKLAQLTPVPDVTVHLGMNHDASSIVQPYNFIMIVSFPVPIWDRNQGGIIQAEGNLVNATEEEHRVRDALTTTLADAFERYEDNRVLLEYYRDQILPDQVRAYRGVYQRYLGEAPRVGGNPPTFGDVVAAQQTLATALTTYVTTLGSLWQAVVDVANVAQTDDLFQLDGEPQPTLPVCRLPELPCQHPCSPLADPGLRGGDGSWPPAEPGSAVGEMLPPPRKEKD